MNTISLNSLWSYLQSLALTPDNKKWLAEHLYESVKEEALVEGSMNHLSATTHLLSEEELPESVRRLIGVAAPVAEDDINGIDAYYSHLEQKYA